MKGIQFLVDDKGKKKAVLIDLDEWGEVWEDIYDILIARSRKDEPLIEWVDLKAELVLGVTETLIASESSLAKDWLRPEEDEAWRDL